MYSGREGWVSAGGVGMWQTVSHHGLLLHATCRFRCGVAARVFVLSQALVWRQPFPGPGLAIRLLCAEEPYIPPDAEQVAARVWGLTDQLTPALGLHVGGRECVRRSVFAPHSRPARDAQASVAAFVAPHEGYYATLLPCRSVGVQGDCRSYRSLVALSCDGDPDWQLLLDIAKEIPKKARPHAPPGHTPMERTPARRTGCRGCVSRVRHVSSSQTRQHGLVATP